MSIQRILAICAACITPLLALVVSAQDTAPTLPPPADANSCAPALESLWTVGSDVCIGAPEGFICNGGGAPAAEPAGPVANALAPVGALVETALVDVLQTPPTAPEFGSVGLMWMRIAAPLRVTALLLGSVSIRDMSPPDFPAWQSMMVQTAPEPSSCLAAPQNALILQTPLDLPARVAVNGASLALNGTVLVRAANDQTILIGLSGISSVIAFGQEQTLFTGQQILLPYNPGDYSRPAAPPPPAAPLDLSFVRNLPIPLLDRPFVLPQPGIVTTQGTINLRVFPSTDAGIIIELGAGQTATVLGVNPAGDWYHVRVPTGETGWLKADLLRASVGPIDAIYDATPVIPQRFGELGRAGRIISPAGVNLRVGPDPGYPALASLNQGAVVTLLERSPYSPWVKVDAGGVIGWVALVTLDTRAFIDALPIDFSAPPQPTPTTVPGSFGNAFPDPNNPGN
jgi:uncharacterized protein YraI